MSSPARGAALFDKPVEFFYVSKHLVTAEHNPTALLPENNMTSLEGHVTTLKHLVAKLWWKIFTEVTELIKR